MTSWRRLFVPPAWTGRAAVFAALLLAFALCRASSAEAEELYLINGTPDQLLVFDSQGATPTPAVRNMTFAGVDPYGVAVRDQELFITTRSDSILVYNATATDPAGYRRRITGSSTGLANTKAIVTDGADLYVADETNSRIYVFNVLDDGDVAPQRTISIENSGGIPQGLLRGLAVHGDELFLTAGNTTAAYSLWGLPKSSSGTTVPPRRITLPGGTTAWGTPRGLFVDDDGIYVGDDTRIMFFPLAGNGTTAPTRTISGLTAVYGLVVRDGLIYATSNAGSLQVFNATADGAAAPLRTIAQASDGISSCIGVAMATESVVTVPRTQPSGVEVAMNGTVASAPSGNAAVQASGLQSRATLKSDAVEFNATVSPAGSAAVFQFNATNLSGTVGDYMLYKVFANGTSRTFAYAANATYTDGAWWLTDADETWLPTGQSLTQGTNYYIHLVVKDNGDYDGNAMTGQIRDPSVLGLAGGGLGSSGCVLQRGPSDAWSAAEWLALAALGLVAVLLRRRLRG